MTVNGSRIEVAANVGGEKDAVDGMALGADGVGLLRSEFLFLDRTSAPDEDEQYEAYTAVVKAFAGEPRIVIRTLDVGGDKPLAYLPMPREDNPFLGIRGIRLAEGHVELLRTQLRAILRASVHGQVHVMFPMVTTLDEWTRARALLEREREALGIPRARGDHGRSAGRRADGGAVRGQCGFLLHRNQRPHAIHAGHGPRASGAGVTGGRAAPGRPAAHRPHRRGQRTRTDAGLASAVASPVKWKRFQSSSDLAWTS